jgi:hypothetical protein
MIAHENFLRKMFLFYHVVYLKTHTYSKSSAPCKSSQDTLSKYAKEEQQLKFENDLLLQGAEDF